MNWVDKSTLDNFMEEQRRRIIIKLWLHETPADNKPTDDYKPWHSGSGYTRRELMRDGHLESRS